MQGSSNVYLKKTCALPKEASRLTTRTVCSFWYLYF